jgi:hypothetical protein
MLGTALGSLTLALTGMLYLTGWTERNKLLKEFGVSASIVPEPLHNTLARGYTPLLIGIFVAIAVLLLLLLILNRTLGWIERRCGGKEMVQPTPGIGAAVAGARARLIFGMIAVGGILLALLVSHLSGIVSARVKEHKARAAVEGGCGRCFSYRVGGVSVRARILAQNDARSILLTSGGHVRIVATDAISEVSPPPD